MLNIFQIPKNAGNFARLLNFSLRSDRPLDVVILRNPYDRFWSATKTVVSEISLFGSFPFEDGINMRTTYEGLDFSVEDVIGKSLAMLDNTNYYIHLKTQSAHIGDNRFDEVVYVESLNSDIQNLIENYDLKSIENFSMDRKLTVSPKERDVEAMAYIMNTPSVKDRLDEFYAADFDLLNDPSSILK